MSQEKTDGPEMLTGTQSRAEREASRVMAASQKRRNRASKLIMTLIAVLIVGGGVAWYFANRQANHVADENAKNGQVVKSASSVKDNANTSSSKVASQYAIDWAPIVKTISPEDYINNIYGKTPQLFLIVGSSADARVDQLAKLTKSNTANFGLNTPIYFLDANRYYTNGNNTDRAAFVEILNSMQLAKIDPNKLPSAVDFESTMYANKLTKVDGKAAYAKYTAPAKSFDDGKTLDAFLKVVNQAMDKK